MKSTQQCLAYHITSIAMQCHTLIGRQSTVNHPQPKMVVDTELLASYSALEITAVDL